MRCVGATLLLVALVGVSLSVEVQRADAASVGDQIAALPLRRPASPTATAGEGSTARPTAGWSSPAAGRGSRASTA